MSVEESICNGEFDRVNRNSQIPWQIESMSLGFKSTTKVRASLEALVTIDAQGQFGSRNIFR
jgi:hypothetical protein